MKQDDFHRLYSQAGEGFTAELINGVVYVREAVSLYHSTAHLDLVSLFAIYRGATPGVEVADNATVILGEEDEVQPDLFMRILPERNGQSQNTKDGPYIAGAPELVAEIALTSRAIDLHLKKQRYGLAGLVEYIVHCLKPTELHWLDLQSATELQPDSDGIFRSKVFPGFWIHRDALLKSDYKTTMQILESGIASPEHKQFLEKLY
ncbi:MAG TPA: Uma2 family endonuclease [Planktothrix sp.]|jgi:Uma2 family endonuclease